MNTRRKQAGAATLVMVMVLFFIISLVAAYTSRNLIFEQRTSANQYRSTQALEAAEAGLEWAISMLNFGRINDSCLKSSSAADTSFRQRYLNVDATTGKITPVLSAGASLTPACVRTPTGWDCKCPDSGVPSLTAPTDPGVWPAFRVRFMVAGADPTTPTDPRQPGTIRAEVVGCTRVDPVGGDQCLSFDGRGALNEGRVLLSAVLALTGGPAGLPVATLTAGGPVNAPLTVANTSPSGSGITVHARNAIDASMIANLSTTPGTPAANSIIENDTALNLPAVGTFTTPDRMFASFFNMRLDTFRTQQAALVVDCPSGCSASAVNTAISLNPHRPLWLTGPLNADANIGTAAEPVLIVVNGGLKFTSAGAKIHGMVYNRLDPAAGLSAWATDGAGEVIGAVVAEGGVSGTGTSTLTYDADVLARVRHNVGTFVRAPGSWRDFR